MSYLPLARKYRPAQFGDLVGQDSIVMALGNSIKLGREPQAIIFTGTRGIGKTSLARLYAKALNCDKGSSENPCNQCDSCLLITEGRHEDVHEIDGASHTGVDDVRELQSSLSYVAQRSKYRIIIIDEVHMLSQSAFNALLKTLEEPPEHVKFVFATTEINKIPTTVLSRCQLFHLRSIPPKKILERLKEIAQQEGITYQDSALSLIAEQGRGSMRDALTLLDQVVALGNGSVSEQELSGLISSVGTSNVCNFLENLLLKHAVNLLSIIESWDQSGISFSKIIEDCALFCRHVMIAKEIGVDALGTNLLVEDKERVIQLATLAQSCSVLDLNRIFRILMSCRSELSGSFLDRFVFENNVMEWCFDPGLPNEFDWNSLQSNETSQSQSKAVPRQTSTQLVSDPKLNSSISTPHNIDTSQRPQSHTRKLSFDRIKDASNSSSSHSSNGTAATNLEPSHPKATTIAPKVTAREHEVRELSVQPETISPEPSKIFPSSWEALVSHWMHKHPLEARMLEDCVLIEYSPKAIKVATGKHGLVGSRLFQVEMQSYIRTQLSEMFGFNGVFLVQETNEHSANELTLKDHRFREKQRSDEDIAHKIQNHPLTLNVIEALGAKIEHVEVRSGT